MIQHKILQILTCRLRPTPARGRRIPDCPGGVEASLEALELWAHCAVMLRGLPAVRARGIAMLYLISKQDGGSLRLVPSPQEANFVAA